MPSTEPASGPAHASARIQLASVLPPVVFWSWLLSRLLFFGPLLIAVQRQPPGALASRLRATPVTTSPFFPSFPTSSS